MCELDFTDDLDNHNDGDGIVSARYAEYIKSAFEYLGENDEAVRKAFDQSLVTSQSERDYRIFRDGFRQGVWSQIKAVSDFMVQLLSLRI